MSRPFLSAIGALLIGLFAFPALAGSLLFAVNEGTSSSTDAIFMKGKYSPLAEYLSAASGEKIVLETPKVLSIVDRNLKNKRYDVLLVRPSHLSARAMRDHGYRLLAAANGDAKVHFIVRGDSKLRELADIKGHSVAMPDPLAYPTHLGLAVLRDKGIKPGLENIHYMDRQDAVAMVVSSGMSEVGVVMSYSKPGSDWQKNGGRFLYTKGNLPYWSIIVSPSVPPQTVERLKRALLALNGSAKHGGLLADLGIAGFNDGKQQAYLDMLEWVEGKRPAEIARVM